MHGARKAGHLPPPPPPPPLGFEKRAQNVPELLYSNPTELGQLLATPFCILAPIQLVLTKQRCCIDTSCKEIINIGVRKLREHTQLLHVQIHTYWTHYGPYTRLLHCPVYFIVCESHSTLSMSCSTVWGVQDGRMYSVMYKSVQRLSSIGHEITYCPSPF